MDECKPLDWGDATSYLPRRFPLMVAADVLYLPGGTLKP